MSRFGCGHVSGGGGGVVFNFVKKFIYGLHTINTQIKEPSAMYVVGVAVSGKVWYFFVFL